MIAFAPGRRKMSLQDFDSLMTMRQSCSRDSRERPERKSWTTALFCVVGKGARSPCCLKTENRYWQRGSYGDTEDNSSLRMIAATVLRELRLLDAINIATRRNGRGGSDYKLLEQLGGHVEGRLSSS